MSNDFAYTEDSNTGIVTLQLRNGLSNKALDEFLTGDYDQLWLYYGNFEKFIYVDLNNLSFSRLKFQSSESQNIEWINNIQQISTLELRGKVKGSIEFKRFNSLKKCNIDWCNSTKSILSANLPLESLGLRRFSGDLSELGDLTCRSLRILGLSGSITTLSGIEKCKNIQKLSIYNMPKLTSISNILYCHNIKSLQIEACNGIEDIDAIKNIESLEEIYFENKQLRSLNVFPRKNLRYIRLGSGTHIQDNDVEVALLFNSLTKISYKKKKDYKYSAEELNALLYKRDKGDTTK